MTALLSEKLVNNISKVIHGKKKEIELICAALLAGGHVLMEDVPGTGKTMLAKAIAKSIDCGFKRIQFTPDLLPSDITGINFYNMKEQEFILRKGAVFTNILLADEINRATPRTQSALLECMEEYQATIDGETYGINKPFFVIATQNPAEIQGTYPLPEAQLDRFMIRMSLGYPEREEEIDVIKESGLFSAAERLEPVCGAEDILNAQKELNNIRAGDALCGYISDIAAATRRHGSVKLGLSTRGAVALKRMACSIAACSGRDYAMPQDVKAAAPYVIKHRLICRGYSVSGGADKAAGEVVKQVLESVAAPTEETW